MSYATQSNPQNNSQINTPNNHWIPLNLLVNQELELEQINLSHTDPLFTLIQENKEHLSKWLGWANKTNTPKDTTQFINYAQEEYKKQMMVAYTIKYNQYVVGLIDIKNIDWNTKSACLGYWIAQKASGKGIITLCCQTLISYAFHLLQLNQIIIRCAPGNQKSANVAKRLGFTYLETLENAEELNGTLTNLDIYVLKRQ